MWRLMRTDTGIVQRDDQTTRNVLSFTRTVMCLTSLIFMIMFTSILTVATLCEHFTNLCIGLLLILMLFFVIYSITAVRTSFIRNSVIQASAVNDDIWTTITDMMNIRNEETVLKDPPSYDSVMKDSNSLYFLPPPYSEVIAAQHIGISCLPQSSNQICESRKGNQVIIDVSTLSCSSSH